MKELLTKWNKKKMSIIDSKYKWLMCALFFFTLISCTPSLLKSPEELVFKPLESTFPHVEPVRLENGMVVYLLEYHELPLFNLFARPSMFTSRTLKRPRRRN